MAISFLPDSGVFTLETQNTTYQMKISDCGYLLHSYYGEKARGDLSYLLYRADHGFSGNPNDAGRDRTYSMDVQPQEYSGCNTGDFRTPCLAVRYPDGSMAADLRYASHRILKGKPALEGLPGVACGENQGETLIVTLRDKAAPLEAELQYTVLEEYDVITRSCRVVNRGNEPVALETALSCCLDFLSGDWELLSFYGRHGMERNVERTPLRHGKIVVDSVRGTSSHQQNPFVVLCQPGTDENHGLCYGMSFVYSGNFSMTAELDQFSHARVAMGIAPQGFSWRLAPEESFQAPEVVLCCAQGFAALSKNYSRLYRERLCRGAWRDQPRPVLINSWEAAYFDFDDEKLVRIAVEAQKLGIDLLVMDDGWFGKRDDDSSGLGDWTVNPQKLKGGLNDLCARVNAAGLKMGIWIEPEMVSEDSRLYRAHPDWCLRIPGREPCRSRYQLVLDLSRDEVVDYLYQAVSAVLESGNLEYVKWDMNRHLTDVYSAALPAGRQGEVSHRYVLGLYRLLERLTQSFPKVLFEGCSGGGGRFDAGMLYYTPQIWCSDNTDAVDRVAIQYGTSFGYPVSAVGSHVAAVPSHQTGRTTPMKTRGVVAMAGTFGYELDPEKLSPEEKEEVRAQVAFYKKWQDVINFGDYYRLTDVSRQKEFAAWQFVSQDRGRSLVGYVSLRARFNMPPDYLKLAGLDEEKSYRVAVDGGEAFTLSGSALMNAGLKLAPPKGDYASLLVELEAIKE